MSRVRRRFWVCSHCFWTPLRDWLRWHWLVPFFRAEWTPGNRRSFRRTWPYISCLVEISWRERRRYGAGGICHFGASHHFDHGGTFCSRSADFSLHIAWIDRGSRPFSPSRMATARLRRRSARSCRDGNCRNAYCRQAPPEYSCSSTGTEPRFQPKQTTSGPA